MSRSEERLFFFWLSAASYQTPATDASYPQTATSKTQKLVFSFADCGLLFAGVCRWSLVTGR